MTQQNELKATKRSRARTAVAAGVLVGGVVAGGVTVSALSAAAATTPAVTTTAPSGTAAGSGSTPPTGATSTNRSSTPVRSDEKPVTGTLAASLKAKALAAVRGGTVYRIETDAGDGAYEAHMTKADGSTATVKFDSSGTVTQVQDGMGTGDPAPAGGTGSAPATTGGPSG